MTTEPIAPEIDAVLMKTLGRLVTGPGSTKALSRHEIDQLGQSAFKHGVHRCLFHEIDRQEGLKPLAERLKPQILHDVAIEAAREQEFCRVLLELDLLKRFSPVIFKGQALAYSLYPQMWMRPRNDIDMLIDQRDREAVVRALEDLGYQQRSAVGDLIMPQTTMYRDHGHSSLAWDIHWRLSNRPAFAEYLSYETLAASCTTIGVKGHPVYVPRTPHNLLIACIHLIGHHVNDIRLIWLHDIHLLVSSLSKQQQERFIEQATGRPEVWAACHAALALTERYMHAARTGELLRALDPGTDTGHLVDRTYMSRLIEDTRAVKKGNRLRFVAQHMFPSGDYMMKRFGIRRRWQLPVWYAIRAGRAIPKLFRKV